MSFIAVINGPNLNRLGKRDSASYGNADNQALEQLCACVVEHSELELNFLQSNSEGALVDMIHSIIDDDACLGVVINAGAYTHTSIAIADAIEELTKVANKPCIEVHISNIYKREGFRHRSYLSSLVDGVIVGLGINGYALAIGAIIQLIPQQKK